MEDQINNWQNTWQKQKSSSIDLSDTIQRLNKIEKKEKLERIKLSIVLLFLVVATFLKLSELLANKFYVISYILILIAIYIRLIHLYKSKYRPIPEESSLNNHDFIKLLKKKITFKTKNLLVFLSILVLTLNMTLLGLYEKGTVLNFEINKENRIFFHLFTLVFISIAYLYNKRKLDNNKKEVIKLITDLQNCNT